MELKYNDNIKLIKMFKSHSPFPKEITDLIKFEIKLRKSPVAAFADSLHLNIDMGKYQTFLNLRIKPHKNLVSIRTEYQREFNKVIKSIISIDEEIVEIYPELVL